MRNLAPRLVSSVVGVTVVVALGILVGVGLGVSYWRSSGHSVDVAATIRIVNDQASLTSVLANDQAQASQDTGFISGEVSRLSSDAFAQELSTALRREVQALTVTQVATSDLVQLSTNDPDGTRAIATLNAAIKLYRTGRQASALQALKADLQATERRLAALENVTNRDSANVEVARLLAHQSDLVAAQARLADMVPVVSVPARMPSGGLGSQVLMPLIGGLLGGLLAALLIGAARLRDRSIRSPADLTTLGYRVLMPVFDLNRRGSWDYTARIILGQLPSVHRGERLLLLAVDPAARADIIADVLLNDRDQMTGLRAMTAADPEPPQNGTGRPGDMLADAVSRLASATASDDTASIVLPGRAPGEREKPPSRPMAVGSPGPGEPGGAPLFEALDVRSILTRRTDPSESAVLVVALGRSRRDWVMGAFRAVNAAGMACSGVILTTGQTDEEPVPAAPVRRMPWQHVR